MQVVGRTFYEGAISNIAELQASERDAMQNILSVYLQQHLNARVHMCCEAKFSKMDAAGLEEYEVILPMSSQAIMVYSSATHYLHRQLDRMFKNLDEHIEAAETCGTGFTLVGIVSCSLHVARVRVVA